MLIVIIIVIITTIVYSQIHRKIHVALYPGRAKTKLPLLNNYNTCIYIIINDVTAKVNYRVETIRNFQCCLHDKKKYLKSVQDLVFAQRELKEGKRHPEMFPKLIALKALVLH